MYVNRVWCMDGIAWMYVVFVLCMYAGIYICVILYVSVVLCWQVCNWCMHHATYRLNRQALNMVPGMHFEIFDIYIHRVGMHLGNA